MTVEIVYGLYINLEESRDQIIEDLKASNYTGEIESEHTYLLLGSLVGNATGGVSLWMSYYFTYRSETDIDGVVIGVGALYEDEFCVETAIEDLLGGPTPKNQVDEELNEIRNKVPLFKDVEPRTYVIPLS